VGELKREVIGTLRQANDKRAPRSKGRDRRDQIPDMVCIHLRQSEVEDRQFPGR
jgi:IS30 family transposase